MLLEVKNTESNSRAMLAAWNSAPLKGRKVKAAGFHLDYRITYRACGREDAQKSADNADFFLSRPAAGFQQNVF